MNYHSPDFKAVLHTCLDNWQDRTPWSILADTLRDQDAPEVIAQEATPFGPLRTFDIWAFGSGIGSGSGSGSGSGRGIGRGSGSGRGIGSGIGRGSGRGSGSGRGIGSGIGRGIGSGSGQLHYGVQLMETGKAYLFFCGDWHAFVGRVVGQTGPFTYQLENVSKINDTHAGDNWEKLAAGDAAARKACDYRHYTTPVFLPLTIAAVEWVGTLPQEKTAAKR